MLIQTIDCLIIGGGPSGLTAAIYLARFLRSVHILDAGHSRAAQIPITHNYPGFANGVSGQALIQAMREQATTYGVGITHAKVDELIQGPQFQARYAETVVNARYVILATGLRDKDVQIDDHAGAVEAGLLRYCPVCDGYEVQGKRVGVIGDANDMYEKAIFLKGYTNHVTLLHSGRRPIRTECANQIRLSGIHIVEDDGFQLARQGREIVVAVGGDESIAFDTVYPALGCSVGSTLAKALGARCNDVGCLIVDNHQQTTVPRLYAVGDVVSDLHQIAVGAGHAAIAAARIHRELS